MAQGNPNKSRKETTARNTKKRNMRYKNPAQQMTTTQGRGKYTLPSNLAAACDPWATSAD
jgi:hypothetical protein